MTKHLSLNLTATARLMSINFIASLPAHTHIGLALASFLPPTFCLYLLSYADRFILVFFPARSASNTPSRRPIPSLTSSCPSCSFRGCMPCTCRACAWWAVQTADLDARPTTGGKHRDEHLLRVGIPRLRKTEVSEVASWRRCDRAANCAYMCGVET